MNNRLLLVIAAVIALAAYFMLESPQEHAGHADTQQEAHNDHVSQGHDGHSGEVTSTGTPAIGGEFSLVDQHGNPYTHEQLKGHYSLVFFGFTRCPDMCPAALSHMTLALEEMDASAAAHVTPVFISVDPERDTVEVMKSYAESFHPRLVALTGTKEQTRQAASAFKVYHQIADPSVEDYMVNHSGFIYVMDKEGRYTKHFSHVTAPETMAAELQQLVQQ